MGGLGVLGAGGFLFGDSRERTNKKKRTWARAGGKGNQQKQLQPPTQNTNKGSRNPESCPTRGCASGVKAQQKG